MGFPPPSLPPTPQNLAMPTHFPPHYPPQPAHSTAASNERIQDVMDSDREDGELSEGEVSSHPPPARVNGRARPEPPRSVPQPPHTSSQAQNGYSPSRPAAGQAAPKGTPREAPQRASPPTVMYKVQKDREDAKQFIKVLHSNNIPYRTLAGEKLDLELLRGLYQSVNLPSEPAPILPPKANGTSTAPAVQPVPSAQAHQLKPAPVVKTNINPAPSAKSAASPTTPGDRKDYIARLQAAKAAKQAGVAKPSPPQQTPPAKPTTPAPATKTPQPATTPNAKPPVTDEQRARNTELIKQRLEAIKARQKAPVIANKAAMVAPVPPEQVTRAATPTTSTPTNHGYMPPFPGIPGLFMNAPPASGNSTLTAPQPSPAIPQKRPAPADSTEVSTPRGSVTPYTCPLGQSPHADQEDDSMIIDVSEDESNGSDMDIEDDQPAIRAVQVPRPDLTILPSRAGSAMPTASAVSTPGAQTPTTVARENELADKEKKLVAMRETLKKKLAEKRERDKAAAAAAATSSPTSQKPYTPLLPPQSDTPSKLLTPMPVQSHNTAIDPAHSNVDSQRNTKRLRRAEIQSRLPNLDAEIALNASRMAQLTKEMEQLTAQNARIARDKEQLTKELEDIGIDTEGMSHAELRAKKDEIEREQSVEPEPLSQEAKPAPQPFSNRPYSTVRSSIEGLAATAMENEMAVFSTSLPPSSQIPSRHDKLPGFGLGEDPSQPQPQPPQVAENLGSPVALGASSKSDVTADTISGSQLSPEKAVQSHGPAAEGSPVHATPAPETQESAVPPDDDEDFYSPPPPADMDLDLDTGRTEYDADKDQTTVQPAIANSPSEEGEVAMSVSEGEDEEEEEYEPDYEPEEPAIVADMPGQEAQNTETGVAPSVPTSQVSTEDEEAYEPPDVDQEMSDVEHEAAVAERSPEAGQVEAEDGAMDIASSSEESSDESDSDDEFTPEPEMDMENSRSANNLPQQDTNVADDLALELQPETTPSAAVVEPVRVSYPRHARANLQ
jgi:hypothetical protein